MLTYIHSMAPIEILLMDCSISFLYCSLILVTSKAKQLSTAGHRIEYVAEKQIWWAVSGKENGILEWDG